MYPDDLVSQLVERKCRSGCLLLLIGPAGTGKTSLVLHISRVLGGRTLYINTEGSPNDERALQVFFDKQELIRIAHVISQEELLSSILNAWWASREIPPDTIIVDSVNNLYRPQAWEGDYPLDLFTLINATLYQISREGGRVLATAQVSMDTGRPSGAPVLSRYNTYTIYLERAEGAWRKLLIPKDGLECVFRIVERGVEWKDCVNLY